MEPPSRNPVDFFPLAAVTGVVLAGGKSRRMGRDKAWIEVGGKPMIHHALDLMGELFTEVLVTAASPENRCLPVPVIADRIPGAGPIGGIHAALHWVSRCRKEGIGIFAAACDMPFLTKKTIETILRAALDPETPWDVVLPKVGGRRHPLCAFYRTTCLEPLEEKILRGDYTLHTFWPEVRVREIDEDAFREVDPAFRFLTNLNDEDDLRRFM